MPFNGPSGEWSGRSARCHPRRRSDVGGTGDEDGGGGPTFRVPVSAFGLAVVTGGAPPGMSSCVERVFSHIYEATVVKDPGVRFVHGHTFPLPHGWGDRETLSG